MVVPPHARAACRIAGAGRFSELGNKWLNIVRAHACILPAKHGVAILARLGVLGDKPPLVAASKRRSGNDDVSRPRSF